MIRIHREGFATILIALLVLTGLHIAAHHLLADYIVVQAIIFIVSLVLLYIILQFFRNPVRKTAPNELQVIAPADGKVVVIEETEEPEFFKGKRLQVSIFMSQIGRAHV